jgi:hypothetical protein
MTIGVCAAEAPKGPTTASRWCKMNCELKLLLWCVLLSVLCCVLLSVLWVGNLLSLLKSSLVQSDI